MITLWTTSLTQLAYLIESVKPCLVIVKISFIYLFFVCLCLDIALQLMSHYEYFLLSLNFRNWLNRLISKAACRVSDLKSLEQWPSSLSLKVSWMEVYSVFYGWLLRTASNWGLAVALLDQQMYQKMFGYSRWREFRK